MIREEDVERWNQRYAELQLQEAIARCRRLYVDAISVKLAQEHLRDARRLEEELEMHRLAGSERNYDRAAHTMARQRAVRA